MTLDDLKLKHAALLTDCFDFSPQANWLELVDELLTGLTRIGDEESVQIQVRQIKSKFESMRCYLGPAPDAAHELVSEYERRTVAKP